MEISENAFNKKIFLLFFARKKKKMRTNRKMNVYDDYHLKMEYIRNDECKKKKNEKHKNDE